VRHVVQENLSPPATVQRVEVSAPPTQGGLTEQIENLAAGNLDSTSDAMEDLLNKPGNIQVINQSQGVSPATAFKNIANAVFMERASRGNPEEAGPFEKRFKEDLGIPEDVDLTSDQGGQRLMAHIEHVFQTSPKIAEAKQRYEAQSQKLEEAGIVHVVAVGNERDVLGQLDAAGISYGEDAARSVFVNDKTITVGASTGEDEIASFSSSDDEVDVAVDGTGIGVGRGQTADGTSFAAPQVAAAISGMFAANPNLTNDQVRDILRQSSRDTPAPADLEGHGILDQVRARQLAEESLSNPDLLVPEL
jgi:hypothetical protein